MSNLTTWAREELDRLVEDGDEMQKRINKDILEIVSMFANQGHSGFTATYAIGILRRLLMWLPITPLTGEEDEWCEVQPWADGNTQQNKRCPAVFRKDFDNSTAYYLDGKIFSDDGGRTWFTNSKSFVPVTFPYLVPTEPERVYIQSGQNEDK